METMQRKSFVEFVQEIGKVEREQIDRGTLLASYYEFAPQRIYWLTQ